VSRSVANPGIGRLMFYAVASVLPAVLAAYFQGRQDARAAIEREQEAEVARAADEVVSRNGNGEPCADCPEDSPVEEPATVPPNDLGITPTPSPNMVDDEDGTE